MSLVEALALSLKVLADWRVLAMAGATLLIVAALRYAGSVYRSPSPRIRRAPPAPAAKKPAARARGAREAAAEEAGEGMIE